MKLLTPTQQQTLKSQETARDALRTVELNRAADQARKNLASSEADFQQMLAGQRARWAREEQEHQERCQEMQEEIRSLQELVSLANVPIEELKKQSEGKLTGVGKVLKHLEDEEERNEELATRLQDKLDELGQRESDLKVKEERSALLERDVLKGQKSLSDKGKEINQKMSELLVERARVEKEQKEAEKALVLREQSLVAKEESYRRTQDRLLQWETQLKDERGVLDRMYIRMGQSKK